MSIIERLTSSTPQHDASNATLDSSHPGAPADLHYHQSAPPYSGIAHYPQPNDTTKHHLHSQMSHDKDTTDATSTNTSGLATLAVLCIIPVVCLVFFVLIYVKNKQVDPHTGRLMSAGWSVVYGCGWTLFVVALVSVVLSVPAVLCYYWIVHNHRRDTDEDQRYNELVRQRKRQDGMRYARQLYVKYWDSDSNICPMCKLKLLHPDGAIQATAPTEHDDVDNTIVVTIISADEPPERHSDVNSSNNNTNGANCNDSPTVTCSRTDNTRTSGIFNDAYISADNTDAEVIPNDADTCVTPCGHCYHYACVQHGLRYSTCCPVCRERITSLRHCYIVRRDTDSTSQDGELYI